jgi:hypothetical protein
LAASAQEMTTSDAIEYDKQGTASTHAHDEPQAKIATGRDHLYRDVDKVAFCRATWAPEPGGGVHPLQVMTCLRRAPMINLDSRRPGVPRRGLRAVVISAACPPGGLTAGSR